MKKIDAADYHSSLAQFFWEESIRIDSVIWLASNGESPSPALEDFLEDHDAGEIKRIIGFTPTSHQANNAKEFLTRLVREAKIGFLVEALTPVPTDFHEGGYISSWSACRCQWFYADALDWAFASRLLEFREKVVTDARKRLKNKSRK